MIKTLVESTTISVVIPCFNESGSIRLMHEATTEVLRTLGKTYELIFVDDGSSDDTVLILTNISAVDEHVRVVELSRNFGKEVALTAGIDAAVGAAVITLDADLQHPPAYIPTFIDAWEAGAEVVVGVREGGSGQTPVKRACSWIYYRILNSIAEYKVVPSSTDYRLIDREVANAFGSFTERNRITRGLIDWLGYRRDYVYFRADVRAQGQATYSPSKLVHLALNSFVSTSLFPLKVAGYLGIFITMVAAFSAFVVGFDKYVLSDPLRASFTGTSLITIFVVFLVGIILSCLGLIALYIANIHTEVINRPLYVVRSPLGSRPRRPLTGDEHVDDNSRKKD